MSVFQFKHFSVSQSNSSMKVGTDSMILGSLVRQEEEPVRILDVGAGSGVLSLMMAQKYPDANITAIEMDPSALIDCSFNFKNSSWNERLFVLDGDFLHFNSIEKFDLIISNPPFFENSLKNDLESKTLARHTDSLPLDLLAQKVSELLSENGSFWVILPVEAAEKLISFANEHNLFPSQIFKIAGKPGKSNRKVLQLVSKKKDGISLNSLTVRDEFGKYTEDYKLLTNNFHDREL
jgi:tRNA1Val (adenine37-N6)-methyltransferase